MFARKSISPILSVWLVVAFMLVLTASPAYTAHAAAALTVNTLADNETADGFCTLREAITAANTNANYRGCTATGYGNDTITFNISGEIVLDDYLPAITAAGGAFTINGTGQAIGISGDDFYTVFAVPSSAQLTLRNLTIAEGYSSGSGGGVWSMGTLTVVNCTFSENHADSQGGGVSVSGGTLTVNNSTFSGNSANQGGGIANFSTLTVTNSTFSNNSSTSGGGINNNGTLTVNTSTFSDNSAGSGGGIHNEGSLTVTDSTFSGNSATTDTGGGIANYSTLTVTNNTFSNNSAINGGGIDNGYILTVTSSTFFSNSATNGGGISNDGTMTITNGTISNNSASSDGGGIYNSGDATLVNTILANSTAGENCYGSITISGNNIDDGTSCDWGSANGSMSNTDPLLGTLANNGGPTQTMSLLAGSPAIDNGDDGQCPATDQRGVSRPKGAHCDIGAFEVNVYSLYLPLILR